MGSFVADIFSFMSQLSKCILFVVEKIFLKSLTFLTTEVFSYLSTHRANRLFGFY